MTGPQTEIEIRLWRDEFARMRQTPEWTDAAKEHRRAKNRQA